MKPNSKQINKTSPKLVVELLAKMDLGMLVISN
jgi:hypothetical protein